MYFWALWEILVKVKISLLSAFNPWLCDYEGNKSHLTLAENLSPMIQYSNNSQNDSKKSNCITCNRKTVIYKYILETIYC